MYLYSELIFKYRDMNLQEKSYAELQDLFKKAFKEWEKSVKRMKEVRGKECVKYSDFVANRAELRRLMAENAKFHSLIVQADLEMQIRVWTGKND